MDQTAKRDAEGDGMNDPFDLLRDAQKIYRNDVPPWEQPKEYLDKLKEFCSYSEKWRKEQEKYNVRPKNPESGSGKKGITEWDVFHELSMKRLKKNGIHL